MRISNRLSFEVSLLVRHVEDSPGLVWFLKPVESKAWKERRRYRIVTRRLPLDNKRKVYSLFLNKWISFGYVITWFLLSLTKLENTFFQNTESFGLVDKKYNHFLLLVCNFSHVIDIWSAFWNFELGFHGPAQGTSCTHSQYLLCPAP